MKTLVEKWLLMQAMDKFVAPQGINLRSDELLPETLSESLVATVSFLQCLELPGTSIYEYADWCEHSAQHFAKGSLDFAALLQSVQSPAALLKSMPGDFYVFVGIAPHDFRWYLRFYLDPDAEEDERFGRFDLTLPAELAARYKEQVVKPLVLEMQEQDAGEYYRSIQL